MSKVVLLDFVHPLNYKTIKSQRFESGILLSSLGKKWGKGQNTQLLDPVFELSLDLDLEHVKQSFSKFDLAALQI
jgi:hypothetical protein